MAKYRDYSRLDLENQANARWHKAMEESYTAREVRIILRISSKRLAHLRRNNLVLFDKVYDDKKLRYPKFQFDKRVRKYLWRVLSYLGKNNLHGYLEMLYYRKGDVVSTSYVDLFNAGKGRQAVARARATREYHKKQRPTPL